MSAYRLAAALAAGLIFGLGLSLSGMLDPARVRGFLDVTGVWDPSLIFVLGGAVTMSALGYAFSRLRPRPYLAERFEIPPGGPIDAPLILGSGLFGIGWGLSGFCPGPTVAALSLGLLPVFVFAIAMVAGMVAHRALVARPEKPVLGRH